jgi:hypothetical protein
MEQSTERNVHRLRDVQRLSEEAQNSVSWDGNSSYMSGEYVHVLSLRYRAPKRRDIVKYISQAGWYRESLAI